MITRLRESWTGAFGRIAGRIVYAISSIIVLSLMTGCRNIGPGTISRDRFNYGMSISDSWKRQTLLNMVKIRYADSPVFLDIGQIVASYERSSSASAAGGWGGDGDQFPFDSLGLGASGHYADRPTITYNPLMGQSFLRGLMTPIRPESVLLIIQSGWPIDSVLLATLRSINGLHNQTCSVNGGVRANPDFVKVVRILRDLQLLDLLEFRMAPRQKDSGDLTFVVAMRTTDITQKAECDETELRRLLKLNSKAEEFRLVSGSLPADDCEIAIQTRSVMQILAVTSLQAQVPADHIREGRASSGAPCAGDESERVIHICSSKDPPPDAYAAVSYQKYFFWIDNKDLQSKRTFSFLILLLSLVDTGSQAPAPVITIPAR